VNSTANSFAHDEAALHVPVRAAEKKVFVVAACKVGTLVPPDMLDAVATRMQISPTFLHGAGESQIVSPSGSVLAIAPRTGEAVVWADIDPNEADDKCRPDGTDIFATRRPMLYRPIAQSPNPRDADWARLAVILGDDSIYPETFRLAALQNVDVVAVLASVQEKWEIEIGLPERVAEIRTRHKM
jgi:predicted amidohydrolase